MALIGLLASAPLSAAQASDLEIRARNLVSHYFSALMQGDTRTVLRLIDGELLLNRKELLENPEYSEYLSRNYRNSTVSIRDSRQVADNRVEVDASIQKSAEEQFTVLLLVESMDEADEVLLIVSEQDAAN